MRRPRFVLPIEADPCPQLPVELGPKNEGVGKWVPDEKHTLLAKLLGGTQHARKQWPSRIFLDPFCGPGRIQVKGETRTRDGGAVVAWRQSQRTAAPFTHMFLGDIDGERANACKTRLSALGAPVKAFAGPAVETVPKMVAETPTRSLVLAYLDPYNLEFLAFEIIRVIAALKKVDFAVHFSTMDLQRNADMELDETRARFDVAAPGWREEIGRLRPSKAQLPQAFFAYWLTLVKGLGFSFSREMPLVTSDDNAPLYRLVFFSRDKFPNKIWDDVAKGPNRDLFN